MIILGAGGHAKEVLDLLLNDFPEDHYVFFDDTKKSNYLLYDKYVVYNNFLDIPKTHSGFLLGTGNNEVRVKLSNAALLNKLIWKGVRPKKTIIGKHGTSIHYSVDIMQNVIISSSVKIGKGTLLNRHVNLHHDVGIGEFCELAPNSIILGNVQIGDNVFIGAGAIILPNVIIEDNATIGAGTIVNKNVLKSTTVVGNPSKEI